MVYLWRDLRIARRAKVADRATANAILRFIPERARWVEAETWHPVQEGVRLPDGSFRLAIPYGDPRELVMDILRNGAGVAVESPNELKRLVAEEAKKIAAQYLP